MNDYDKLNEIYAEIDTLIAHRVTASSAEFVRWKTKLERFLERKYGVQSKEYTDVKNRSFTP